MNTKVILASLAAFVVSFLMGWLVYGMLLKGYFDANMAIREVLGDGTFPAPMPVFGIQQMSTAAHA